VRHIDRHSPTHTGKLEDKDFTLKNWKDLFVGVRSFSTLLRSRPA